MQICEEDDEAAQPNRIRLLVKRTDDSNTSTITKDSAITNSMRYVRRLEEYTSETFMKPGRPCGDSAPSSMPSSSSSSSSSSKVKDVVTEQTTAISTKPGPLKLTVADFTSTFKHYGPRMRLYCRTGYSLVILPNGIVTSDDYGDNVAGVLEFSSAGVGEVRIRGVQANLYLAMNKKGELYGEGNPRDYATVFVENTYGQYNTYLSQKYAHNGWYVGIKKNGTIKRASLTKWGQKAIQFLPIRTQIER